MRTNEASLVAQINLTGDTYYITDRDGVMLDGVVYDNVVRSWGDANFYGNIGNDEYQIGSFSIEIINGEEFISSGHKFDPTEIWNNATINVRRWESAVDPIFDLASPYVSGIIKNFNIDNDTIRFDVDVSNTNDDSLVPGVIGVDQSGLEDDEEKSTYSVVGGSDSNLIIVADNSIFSVGEFVVLKTENNNIEYNRVLEKGTHLGSDSITLFSVLRHIDPGTIEKAFTNIPSDFVGRSIPIQIGDFTDTSNGFLAKTFTTSSSIGKQFIIADYFNLCEFNSVGVWENGSKKYFKARGYEIVSGNVEGEYTIDSTTNSFISFSVDTATTLKYDITLTDDQITDIYVEDYTKLQWVDEETDDRADDVPEILSTNIISIDAELMQLIAKPNSSTIYVERGYNETEITTHDAGAKIYQSAKFSSKNLLSFTERFDVIGTSNAYFGRREFGSKNFYDDDKIIELENPNDLITSGGFKNILTCEDTYVEYYKEIPICVRPITYFFSNFDIKFQNIDSDFRVYGLYAAIKSEHSITGGGLGYIHDPTFAFSIFSPNSVSTRNKEIVGYDGFVSRSSCAMIIKHLETEGDILPYSSPVIKNTFDTIDRTVYSDSNVFNPDLYSGDEGGGIRISSLKSLNSKWKANITWKNNPISIPGPLSNFVAYLKLYRLGLWIDFFIDFTKDTVVASLKGRVIDQDIVDVTGIGSPDTIGDAISNPIDAIVHILISEMGYATSDFNTSWITAKDYSIVSSNYSDDDIPEIAFSYGVDDQRKKGIEFCRWIASHFLMQVSKDYDGKLDIVNLHEIYNNTPVGSEIKIEDIIFLKDSGNREITVYQSGSDLIYNDIVIKWKRNNYNNDYEGVYILPDSYTLASGNTLSTARSSFYSGKKRTLEIESPFIYNETDARRLAEWKADDQAEVHFFADFNIDYDHYTEVNSLSDQYKIGDIIYFTGEHGGISFTSDEKFYIQNVSLIDSGKKIKIQAKSIKPVTGFTVS